MRPVVRYVDSIADFRRAVRDGKTSTKAFLVRQSRLCRFYGEFPGRRTSKIDYVLRHGEVVQALHDRQKASGLRVGQHLFNDLLIDLGIVKSRSGRLVEVYDVKTGADRQIGYTAIGQIFAHGKSADCKRVIVLPRKDKLTSALTKAPNRNNTEIRRYDLNETASIVL